jgi:hypothetical protein
LHGSLQVSRLTEKTRFQALSWEWGNKTHQDRVISQCLDIRSNLASFLRGYYAQMAAEPPEGMVSAWVNGVSDIWESEPKRDLRALLSPMIDYQYRLISYPLVATRLQGIVL